MYSAQLLDHFQNPRNAGELSDADAVAEIQNPVCGDVIRLSLKMQAQRIEKIRFKAKGCVPAIACGSALTEMVLDKTVNEIRRLRRDDLIAAVGGLPQASSHAAQLAQAKLAEVIAGVVPLSSQTDTPCDEDTEWNWSLSAEQDVFLLKFRTAVGLTRQVAKQGRLIGQVEQVGFDRSHFPADEVGLWAS